MIFFDPPGSSLPVRENKTNKTNASRMDSDPGNAAAHQLREQLSRPSVRESQKEKQTQFWSPLARKHMGIYIYIHTYDYHPAGRFCSTQKDYLTAQMTPLGQLVWPWPGSELGMPSLPARLLNSGSDLLRTRPWGADLDRARSATLVRTQGPPHQDQVGNWAQQMG